MTRRHPLDAVSLVFGLAFTAAGLLFLAGQLDEALRLRWLWPVLLLALGAGILLDVSRRPREDRPAPPTVATAPAATAEPAEPPTAAEPATEAAEPPTEAAEPAEPAPPATTRTAELGPAPPATTTAELDPERPPDRDR
jgi:predicted lipid-binding transport protein (Tim44 family)